ncbi:3'-5' exonuclease [Prevotella sp. HUN102]|uniref:3'-5' exonuclease n=1 Tax=Prevotella sp. HUN102 TaxID=1392486 RepID=UPI00048FFEC4|nr:3'-5' exonuclease [Prevotella sp. HUN102]
MKANDVHSLDDSQIPVVRADNGFHLVLASPGCGKTHILAERIKYAHGQGVKYEDMLCLTFTNRAAREMINRIASVVDDAEVERLQVGNVHHFCSRFLFEENRVEADTSIIDDEEAISIIADYRNESEEGVIGDYNRSKVYQEIIFFSHLMYQMEKAHPWEYYLHPECFTKEDRDAVKLICELQRMEYNERTVVYIYHNAQQFLDDADAPRIDWKSANNIRRLLWKMYYASCYEQYKTEHHLLDFEDLLLVTYDIYSKDADCKRYPWIQVDEVQDLNAMQLAIIDLLTSKDNPVVMYLGDEQQAIFSFMGAKLETLTFLKMRCKGNIHHLLKNHRSPSYLLDVFNDFAEKQLKIDRELLPITDNELEAQPNDLKILPSDNIEAEMEEIAGTALDLFKADKSETTAVIVSSNADADKLSRVMMRYDLSHFKVSGRDLFDTPSVKLLMAHLNVLGNEHNFLAWTRILKGTKAFDSNALARRFVYKLKQLAMSPTDLLLYDKSTYVADFLQTYRNEDIIVFDTETTGLNVFEDDIIEIAAIKIRNGEIIGEPLDIYIETSRPILRKLGENENPLYDLYHSKLRNGALLSPQEGLKKFLEYAGNATLLGHNADYDYNILDFNLRRYLDISMKDCPNGYFDSLKLMRLLERNLVSYKLESLLERFNLVGENSHQAIDDAKATVSLVRLCAQKAETIVAQQTAFLNHPKVMPYVGKFRSAYQELYLSAFSKLYLLEDNAKKALILALEDAYQYFQQTAVISEIDRLEYILRYLDMDMLVDEHIPNALVEQIGSYIMDINTLKESDFCNSRSIRERVYVTTVHKAKGLEFDNVIVFDAVDGRYPNAYNKNKKSDEEDARKFYVAISRAKRRLYIAYSLSTTSKYGTHAKELTPFMLPIEHHFN